MIVRCIVPDGIRYFVSIWKVHHRTRVWQTLGRHLVGRAVLMWLGSQFDGFV